MDVGGCVGEAGSHRPSVSTLGHLAIVAGQSNTIDRRFCFTYHSDIRVSTYDGRKIRR
jgi:hypothetical protein